MTEQLHHVLDELSDELFTCSSAADAVPLLQTLTSLAVEFPSARKHLGVGLGAAIVMRRPVKNGQLKKTKMSVVVERFLYTNTTARLVLRLLAALALDSIGNQQRLVNSVEGVVMTKPTNIQTHEWPSMFYILTLPTAIRGQYKQWRVRQQALQGRRIPTGEPPKRDGVPAPCLCDECLGTPQFLPTWLNHFHDLSNWAGTSSAEPQCNSIVPLTSQSFLQVILSEYELHQEVVKSRANGSPDSEMYVDVDRQRLPIVYYFVPRCEGAQALDPYHHICAIAIDSSITQFPSYTPECATREKVGRESQVMDEWDLTEDIVLHETRMEIQYHHVQSSSTRNGSSNESLAFIPSLLPKLMDTSAPDESTKIINLICSFLTATDVLDTSTASPMTALCDIQVIVRVNDKALKIWCSAPDDHIYTAVVTCNQLLQNVKESDGVEALLRLDDMSLQKLLCSCRLCHLDRSTTLTGISSRLLLLFRQTVSPVTGDSILKSANRNSTIQDQDISPEIVGPRVACLSPAIEQAILRVENLIRTAPPTHNLLIKQLVDLIRNFDNRISSLATNAVRGASTMQRMAVRQRCMNCRDHLLFLCKKIKLREDAFERGGQINDDCVALILRKLDQIRLESKQSDDWETPDDRVTKLHLNRDIWGSGRPDPEYYIEIEARRNASKKKQHDLTKKLYELAAHKRK